MTNQNMFNDWWWNRRLKTGYTDFGGIKIPGRPLPIVMTDITTGLQWMLSFETNPDRISITQDLSSLQKSDGARVYDANSGPLFNQSSGLKYNADSEPTTQQPFPGTYMLIIDNGRLGFIYTPYSQGQQGQDSSLIYARQSSDQRLVNVDVFNPSTMHIGFSV